MLCLIVTGNNSVHMMRTTMDGEGITALITIEAPGGSGSTPWSAQTVIRERNTVTIALKIKDVVLVAIWLISMENTMVLHEERISIGEMPIEVLGVVLHLPK